MSRPRVTTRRQACVYSLRNGSRDAICGVVLEAPHSDPHYTGFVYQDLSQGFTTYPPQIAQLRDPVMTFESCALGAHSKASSVAPDHINPVHSPRSMITDLCFPANCCGAL